MQLQPKSAVRILGLAALGLLSCGVALAAAPIGAVAAIVSGPAADLVVLGAGFDAGFRSGMVCRVTRGKADIGELLLVDVRPSCSSGLISGLASGQAVRTGDSVSSKLLKS